MINLTHLKYSHFCREDYSLIENYDKAVSDQTQMWHCHHRNETHYPDGTLRPVNDRLSVADLKAQGIYYNLLASELIFLSCSDHIILHMQGLPGRSKGYKHTEEAKQKIAAASRGRKLGPLSEEHKRKLSEAHIGKKPSEETRKKKSDIMKCLRWYNNGSRNVRALECPEGFVLGRLPSKKMSESQKGRKLSDETRRKMSESSKGKPRGRFYNNGIINVRAFECPDGFVLGKLRQQTNSY